MIALIGAPGVGKSTVGARLAQRLGLELVDIDGLIEQREQMAIAEIFANHGEPHFRALEQDATCTVLAEPDECVVSLGGGAVMNPAIQEALRGHDVVWLEASASTAANRVGLNVARPLLIGNVRGRLAKLLAERLPVYEQVSTVRVKTDDLTPEQVCDRVLEELGRG
ncbi:shikimate kinase AroK [Mariniluteicoccus endophyticus]